MMVDAEKTRQYYQAMGPGEPCSCNNCKNYYARVKAAYPAAAEYLAGLGVEIEKPLETSPLEPGADGMMEYRACQLCCAGQLRGKQPSYSWRGGSVQGKVLPRNGCERGTFCAGTFANPAERVAGIGEPGLRTAEL